MWPGSQTGGDCWQEVLKPSSIVNRFYSLSERVILPVRGRPFFLRLKSGLL
jgi:hypothetical protein